MVDFLLSGSELAQGLMEQFVFKVVPMVNIDGVVHGNTRAELVGCDSNRQWADPHRHHHPVVHALKKLIEKDNVEMVLDLHSHSRRLGTFFYANHASLNSLTRIFPLLVCKNDHRFDWRGNRFGGGSNLTARKVLADLLKVPLVYTI
jgi:cytosolic carboxypeptidase protein 2/3